jgi:CheY-like chemotaxis protein
MRSAVASADLEQLLVLLDVGRECDPDAAMTMRQLAEHYEYEKLMRMIESEVYMMICQLNLLRRPKPDILIVDDTPANLQVLSGLLQSAATRSPRDQRRARPAGRPKQAARPDPIGHQDARDGRFEVCRQLKADPHLREIPVIFLSALTKRTDKDSGIPRGRRRLRYQAVSNRGSRSPSHAPTCV